MQETLSWRSFFLCLGLSVAIFLFFNPVWVSTEIGAVNQGIWWSYLALPLLVLVFLLLEGKLRASSWFLETLKLVFIKFALTYTLATIGWAVLGPPDSDAADGPSPLSHASEDPYVQREAPAPTPLDPLQTGAVQGRVLDAQGTPLAGAFVYVSLGLEAQRFEVPRTELVLSNRGLGIEPERAVLRAYQPLIIRSLDGELHTVQMTDAHERSVLNYPSVPGSARRVMFRQPLGRVTLSCRVHGEEERESHLLVLASPFHAETDETGRFSLRGLPSGALELTVWARDGAGATKPLALVAAETAVLDFTLR